MTSESTVIVTREETGVAWVKLNRPEVLNACDISTLKKLHTVLKDLEFDSSVRCIVISGSGRSFCAGADLASLKERGSHGEGGLALNEDLREGFNPVVSRIFNMDKPVVAMVNGVAAGAGMSIAFACDVRIMSESARFVEAFAKVGLVPDSGATFTMPRLLGLTKAMELAFSGDGIDSKEAERMGIVTKVVSPENLEKETRMYAEKLASGPRGLGLSKRAIHRAMSLDFDSALEYEADMQQVAGTTEDHREGVTAFTEKRPAKFKGR
jgi:2-(1,2-epoxy-1,2-dihydrophenyl)acetyl-CoA isomerase